MADDHVIFRDGLRKLLDGEDDITIVGEASNGNECIRMLAKLKPDILLLDLRMPDKDGLAVLEEVNFDSLPTRVIVLTAAEDDRDVVRAMRLGARGIVLKQSASDLLVKSIHRVFGGEIWLDNRMTAEVMKAFAKSSESGPRRDKPLLSDREKEIVQLVAQGYRNKEIGEKLFISEQTVKNHLHNIFDKLGVSDRLELALYAIHHRLIDHALGCFSRRFAGRRLALAASSTNHNSRVVTRRLIAVRYFTLAFQNRGVTGVECTECHAVLPEMRAQYSRRQGCVPVRAAAALLAALARSDSAAVRLRAGDAFAVTGFAARLYHGRRPSWRNPGLSAAMPELRPAARRAALPICKPRWCTRSTTCRPSSNSSISSISPKPWWPTHRDEAQAYLLDLWERTPGNSRVNLELARLAVGMGDDSDAERYYNGRSTASGTEAPAGFAQKNRCDTAGILPLLD